MKALSHVKWIAGLAALALLISRPAESALGAGVGLAQWADAVAPTLLPFLALMPLLTSGAANRCAKAAFGRVATALFRLPGEAASAMLIGMLAGSPAGALAVRRVAERSGMSRGQMRRLALAVVGFSPAFLTGVVGMRLMGSAEAGRTLLLSQLLTQLTMALLLRRAWAGDDAPAPRADAGPDEPPMRAAVTALLNVGGYMALFGALHFALRSWVSGPLADGLLCLCDVPSGAALIAGSAWHCERKLLALAAMIGFGGVCVGAQNLTALRGCGVGAARYFGCRLLAAVLCAAFAGMLSRLGETPPSIRALYCKMLDKPMAFAALAASLMALPVALKMRKHIS